jgi:hypothetical protein
MTRDRFSDNTKIAVVTLQASDLMNAGVGIVERTYSRLKAKEKAEALRTGEPAPFTTEAKYLVREEAGFFTEHSIEISLANDRKSLEKLREVSMKPNFYAFSESETAKGVFAENQRIVEELNKHITAKPKATWDPIAKLSYNHGIYDN